MRKLNFADLTFAAEALGKRRPVPVRYLDVLSRHPHDVVREGVVYGLAGDVERSRSILERIAECDTNQIVRDAAREALEP